MKVPTWTRLHIYGGERVFLLEKIILMFPFVPHCAAVTTSNR